MNKTLKSVLKKSLLVFFWFILPPLFLVLSIIWNSPKLIGRIILTIIAPLTLIALIYVSIIIYEYHYYHFKRGNRSEIEMKTELKFPEFQTIDKKHFINKPALNGDFSIEYTVKLDTTNIQNFYNQIETQIETNVQQGNESRTYYWNKQKDENYFFNHIDFENVDNQTLQLTINKKSSIVKIVYGSM